MLAERVRARETRIRELESEIASVSYLVRARENRIQELEKELSSSLSSGHEITDLQARIGAAWAGVEGWCTIRKAYWLANLAQVHDVQQAVEVGIFGGKSFLPLAVAIQAKGGIVYGVEAWSNDAAVLEPTDQMNDNWWANVDFHAVKSRLHSDIVRFGLSTTIRLLDIPSSQACVALSAERFDLIHIDGCHASAAALHDVKEWSKLLSPKGVLVVDDIDWDSLSAARAFISDHFDMLDVIREQDGQSYGAFRLKETTPV